MPNETAQQAIGRYIQDAIAAENNFESNLQQFAKEGDDAVVHQIFAMHAQETRWQLDCLTARLKAMNEAPSAAKSFLAHLFGMAPKAAQMGHDESERTTQNLIIACAVESAEVAMYEALAAVAAAAGDAKTEELARSIQNQERAAWEKVKAALPGSASRACQKLATSKDVLELIKTYLVDANAAEHNVEDLLMSFSRTGNQGEVQDLFANLSARAKAQQGRLTDRLGTLGLLPSTGKSILAHLLGFAPSLAQAGHEPEEKNTQNLIVFCGAAGGQMAMYDALAAFASTAGDRTTEALARNLAQDEQDDFEMAWRLLVKSATGALAAVTAPKPEENPLAGVKPKSDDKPQSEASQENDKEQPEEKRDAA